MAFLAIAAAGVAVARVLAATPQTKEELFVSENQSAKLKMMAGMEIRPSGDVDADFAAMMIPHHQGAIEMAQAELRHGSNEQLRRIAQEIVVDQQQEIAAMRLALGETLPPSSAKPDQSSPLPMPAASSATLPFKVCTGRPR
jgi:uncharacterized protein (DUF305 family)